MSKEIVMRKRGRSLVTVDFMGDDEMDRLPEGSDLLVTVTRKPTRTLEQLRWAWSLAGKIAEAHPNLDKDKAMDSLCELCRHVDVMVSPITGHAFLKRRSISNLSIDEMSRLIDRMIYVTCETIMPGVDNEELRAEIEAMVAPTKERQREFA